MYLPIGWVGIYAWDGFKKHAAASGINCSDRNLSCGFGVYIELVSGASVHASASSWKVVTSRFISWRDISKIKECERN